MFVRHCARRLEGIVEIESQWTARKRERLRSRAANRAAGTTPACRKERDKAGAPRMKGLS